MSSLVRGATQGRDIESLAARLGVKATDRLVQVAVHAVDVEKAREKIKEVEGAVEASYRTVLQASIPVRSLKTLAQAESIARMETTETAQGFAVTGEGVNAINAQAWHAAGLDGAGVKIAIVDSGFLGYQDRQAAGDLPSSVITSNHCANGFFGTAHGTGVAEIVHEVAPAASLYLICAGTPTEKGAALNYIKAQGIKLVTSSTGSAGLDRGDGNGGPGTLDQVVRDASNAGILWINAAGNYGQSHWSGTFSDPDGDGLHNFSGTDTLNDVAIPSGYSGCFILKWDDWPGSDQDFDLYLVRLSDNAIIGASEFAQTGTEPPIEGICVEDTPGNYGLGIARYSGTQAPRFDLYEHNLPFQYKTAEGSVAEPASSPYVLGVGATCWSQDTIASYSSQGPTIDGRLKPDITGPASVSSGTYGPSTSCSSGFSGTSASTPHVAGAAALLLQQDPSRTAASLRGLLESTALDRGAPGKDSVFGWGKLFMPSPGASPSPSPTASPSTSPSASPSPSPSPSASPSPAPGPTVHPRAISLTLRKHLILKGSVRPLDGFFPCSQGAPIKVQKKRSGGWRTLKTIHSDLNGDFRTKVRDSRGRYRVKAVTSYLVEDPNQICSSSTSPTRRHTH